MSLLPSFAWSDQAHPLRGGSRREDSRPVAFAPFIWPGYLESEA